MQRAPVNFAPKGKSGIELKVAEGKVVETVKPVIRFSDIKEVSDNYPQVSQNNQFQAFGSSFAKLLASSSSAMTRELLGVIPQQPDYKQALNPEQLFDTAVILAKSNGSTDLKAASSLRKTLGEARIGVANLLRKKLTEMKVTKEKAALLFDMVCQIPEEHIKFVMNIITFEGVFYRLSKVTLEQIVKYSDRLERLFDLGKQKYELYQNAGENVFDFQEAVFDASSALSAAALILQHYVIKEDKEHTDKIVNLLMCILLQTEQHFEAITYATLWLVNHGIVNEANLEAVREHPEASLYLFQVGSIIADAKKVDLKFQQELFNYALKKGVACKNTLFSRVAADANVFQPEAGQESLPIPR